jgi:alkyl hydroperoxide reductase subunit F
MAILHSDFQHEMIDGAYYQADIERLHIQGVPSILIGDKLIHSGRITLIDLIAKLESEYGVQSSAQVLGEIDLGKFDVVVIGGGPAGASAAIYSARKGLKTAVLAERLGGQVQDTRGIENLISVSYTEGPQLAAQLNKHMADYPIKIFENRRVDKVDEKTKTIHLVGGEKISAASIIVATGAKWRELGVPGEKEYIGRGVAFCPHCDGPYYKGKKIAVIGGGNSGVEAAIDLAGIVNEIVVVEFNPELKADSVLVEKMKTLKNIQVIANAKTTSIDGDGQKVNKLTYVDRATNAEKSIVLEGVFVQIGLVPNSQFLKDAVKLTKWGEVIVDEKGRTSAPGIYAAGDVTTVPYKQIIIAMGEGAKAALAAFEDRMIQH